MDWKFVRKIFTFFLAWLMLNPSGPPSGFAQDDAAKDARRASAVKSAVLQLGAGKDARVTLTLADRKKLTGYVNDVQADAFLVASLCTDQVATVPYGQVRGLRGLNVANGMRVSVSKMPKGTPNLRTGAPCGTSVSQARYVDHEVRNAIIAGAAVAGGVILLFAALGAASR
jgi:hypothetical protein